MESGDIVLSNQLTDFPSYRPFIKMKEKGSYKKSINVIRSFN